MPSLASSNSPDSQTGQLNFFWASGKMPNVGVDTGFQAPREFVDERTESAAVVALAEELLICHHSKVRHGVYPKRVSRVGLAGFFAAGLRGVD